ncbi:hypothetical protein [Deminuibacter soli]|uniref:DUF4116 domain-containing protein n=1 Tax=Deminuibacter soli TaxID=2291815 RepID=A0A3E1NPP0_9BACT|nr:hypothetical protein [Deminuibacter soli]RFM29905.1 hypothetical protein DXN05_02720 [Deminuibacter soli]
MKKLYFLLAVLSVSAAAFAQQAVQMPEIPLMRKKFHDDIDRGQQRIVQLQSGTDNTHSSDEVTGGVDSFQNAVELDSTLDTNNKIKYLRGLNDVLNGFAGAMQTHSVKIGDFPAMLQAYKDAMQLEREGQAITPVVKQNSLETGGILLRSFPFLNNAGQKDSKDQLILKECQLHPERILPILNRNPDFPYTDTLIAVAARRNQEELYNYAAAPNKLGNRICASENPLAKIIGKMARTKAGRQYFPFLDNLYRNKISFEAIDSVMEDSVRYYKLLVKTEIEYATRMRQRDTPLVKHTLTEKLRQKGVEVFINEINGLHEAPDGVRFRKIEPLTPEELYYLAVLGEEEIYTSSYTHGVYPFIFQKMKPARGDSLLMRVQFDHFKKWIKMAANYNTLDNFLKTMEKSNAELLMKAFVRGLDKTNSLEDAVDVANSYASIEDKELQQLVLNEVQYNLQEAKRTGNKRGTNIYGMLNTLFLSMDPANNIDVAATLGIPPVYFMPNKALRDTSGRIVVQQFFYGDKDGNTVFNAFVNSMSNGNWKMTSNPEWVAFSSTRGVPVTIYANRPLDEKQGLDAKAQSTLSNYLQEHNLLPTVVIHRGHSYYLNSTIDQLASSAKVILLGSCGGYQSLSRVLGICPYSQIISSKQTGSGLINQPMISVLLENMREGKDLNWPALWGNFSKIFKGNEMFSDYVPPHKNLGAVFIMAYKKLEEREDDAAGTE